jgi:hypothetical protein
LGADTIVPLNVCTELKPDSMQPAITATVPLRKIATTA